MVEEMLWETCGRGCCWGMVRDTLLERGDAHQGWNTPEGLRPMGDPPPGQRKQEIRSSGEAEEKNQKQGSSKNKPLRADTDLLRCRPVALAGGLGQAEQR